MEPEATPPAIKPRVGEIVIFRNTKLAEAHCLNNGAAEAPAIITRVWSDTCVNLKVLTDGNHDLWFTSVSFNADPEAAYGWRWVA